MTVQRGLDRKARTAVIAAAAVLLAAPLFIVAKLVFAKIAGEQEQIFHPADDQLVMLRDGSTILVKRNSAARRIADWLNLDAKGEQTFQVGNANFVPGSARLSQSGWEHLAQFAQMLKAHRGVTAVVLFSAYHGDKRTVQLEHMRADQIHDEVLKQGVNELQIAVAPEAFQAGHNSAADEGLEVVLTNRG